MAIITHKFQIPKPLFITECSQSIASLSLVDIEGLKTVPWLSHPSNIYVLQDIPTFIISL
jgi:hypothetical protein